MIVTNQHPRINVFPSTAGAAARATLKLHLPPHAETTWLAEVRQMRGKVLYDHGRRPSFLRPNDEFDDPDPYDLASHHIVARAGGKVVATLRHTFLSNPHCGMVASILGASCLDAVIRDMGVSRRRVTEFSRWTALREHRGCIGRRLVAAGWALVRWADCVGFILAGTRDRQDVALIRMGTRPVPGIPLIHCSDLDDDLRLMVAIAAELPQFMLTHVNAAAEEMNLVPGKSLPPSEDV